MEPAPLHAELADGPPGGAAVWTRADDGVRLRVGGWRSEARGTVLIFNGRREYIEKYGRAAREFAARGLALLTLDWRGQGLSDRLLDDPLPGHVEKFSDYQRDVAALLEVAAAQDYPRPWFLLGHSMGGAIGLRALLEGLDVPAAAFSAPMWGIRLSAALRPVARIITGLGRAVGRGESYTPGFTADPASVIPPFPLNTLTGDREYYEWMNHQTEACPALMVGGPSLRWLDEALAECKRLAAARPPDVPSYIAFGSRELVIDTAAVRRLAERFPRARLEEYPGARHEIMMETPEHRQRFFDTVAAHFIEAASGVRGASPAA